MSEKRELVVELRTGQKRPLVTQAPLLTSAPTPWQGLWFEHHQLTPFEATEVCCFNHLVFLCMEGPAALELRREGHHPPTPVLPGQSCILPAQKPFSLRLGGPGELLSVSLEPNFLACAAHGFENAGHLELAEGPALDDPLIRSICLALKQEIESGWPGGRWYGESLATALAVHLIQKHSAQKPSVREDRGGLAKYQLRRAIDYINNHLTEEISLRSLAAAVGMSPYHFARMFKRSTGQAPHQYLLKSRVERARHMFLSSDTSIADVAVQLGFCDRSHLATHFKRVYGVTPKAFLRQVISRKHVS